MDSGGADRRKVNETKQKGPAANCTRGVSSSRAFYGTSLIQRLFSRGTPSCSCVYSGAWKWKQWRRMTCTFPFLFFFNSMFAFYCRICIHDISSESVCNHGFMFSDISQLLYCERSRKFSWDLNIVHNLFKFIPRTMWPQSTKQMSKYCSPLEATTTSVSSFIFYYNSKNSLFASFISNYITRFYRNYKK